MSVARPAPQTPHHGKKNYNLSILTSLATHPRKTIMIIQAEHISKTFPIKQRKTSRSAPRPVLSDISFSIQKPQVVGLIGPNGAGKTTLLKILSSLVLADSGSIHICGHSLGRRGGKQTRQLKACLGLVTPEERSFYWRLSGQQNLDLFAILFGLNKKAANERVKELFECFRISNGNQRFDTYSTGIKRKFALMRALLHQPKVVLLDEPTKSLDLETTTELRRIIQGMPQAGQTVLMATHDLEETQEVCGQLLIIRRGELVGQGTLDNLRQQAGLPFASLKELYRKLTQDNDQ